MWWNDGETTRSAGVRWLHSTLPGCLIISFGCSSRLLFSVLIRLVLCYAAASVALHCETVSVNACVSVFLLQCCIFLLTEIKEQLLPLSWHLVVYVSPMWSDWVLQQREINVFLLICFLSSHIIIIYLFIFVKCFFSHAVTDGIWLRN